MLEELSSIDWHSLSHAYGPADDVPQLLRDLASPHEQIRSRALGTFYTNIYHQGTVYQASAYAVPFLLELVQEESVPERDEIVVLLAHLAVGDAYNRQHLRFYNEERIQDPQFQQDMVEQIFWVDRTHEAVRSGLPLYIRLLKYPDVPMRMSASRLLSTFREEAAQILPVFSQRLQHEQDHRVRACLFYSIGALIARQADNYPEAIALLAQALVEAETELVRVAAAMALLWTGSSEMPPRALDMVLDTILQGEAITSEYETLPWASMRLGLDAIRCLYALPPSFLAPLIPRLMNVLHSLEQQEDQDLTGYIAGELAEFLLVLAFDHTRDTQPLTFEHLADQQCMVLIAIAESDAVWEWDVGKGYSWHQIPLSTREGGNQLWETEVQVTLPKALELALPHTRKDLRTFLRLEAQERDALRIISPYQGFLRPPVEKRREVLDELIRLNPGCQLADLKRLVGDLP